MKKFRKGLFGVLLGGAFLVSCFGAYQRVKPSEQVMQSLKLTLDGTTTGTAFFEASGGNVMDGSGNLFATYGIIDTGFNNTGSDTIIPSEKAIYDYSLPYRTWIKSGVDIYYTGGDIYGASFIAKGAGAAVIGIRTIAIGNNSYASGNYSVAIGDNAGTFGYSSIAIGVDNRSYAQYSTTLGYSNVSNTIGGVSIGKFSLGITGALLEVGNGTTLLARNNILTLLSNGLGIGTTSPQYALDVSGAIAGHSVVLSDVAGVACATTGQIIFSGGDFLGCNGSSWLQLN